MRIAWVAVLAASLACGRGKDTDTDKSSISKESSAPTAAQDEPAPPVPIDVEASAKHLVAGRTLARDKRWAEAVVELEHAVAADQTSARAWSELGWATFQIGDLDRSLVANGTAVTATDDPKLKAASLYNLGRIKEKQQRQDEARDLYQQSLDLRPNSTVGRRLASITPGKRDVAPALHCPEPMARQDLCNCLREQIAIDPTDAGQDWDDAGADGVVATADAPAGPGICSTVGGTIGIEVWRVAFTDDDEAMHGYWVVAGSDTQLYSIAVLRNNIGLMRRAYNEFTLDSVRKQKVGGNEYVRIVAKTIEYEESFGEEQTWKASEVTICPLPTMPGTSCPLQIDRSWSVARAPVFDDTGEQLEEMKTHYGDGLNRERKLDLSIAADGTATVRLTSGAFGKYERDVSGTYKLW